MKELSALFALLLFAISACVAAGISEKQNMWKWICAYWVALTVKNAIDTLEVLLCLG